MNFPVAAITGFRHSACVSLETNSWRVADAQRASLIVDADDYFQAGRLAMLAARRRIMLIGWDFDARIRLGGPSGLEGPTLRGGVIRKTLAMLATLATLPSPGPQNRPDARAAV